MVEIFKILPSAKGSASSNHALPITGAPCVSFEVQGKMTKGNIMMKYMDFLGKKKLTNPQPSVNQDAHGKSISRKPSVDDFSSFSCGWDVPVGDRTCQSSVAWIAALKETTLGATRKEWEWKKRAY